MKDILDKKFSKYRKSPDFPQLLTIKSTCSGVVVLQARPFEKRMTGSSMYMLNEDDGSLIYKKDIPTPLIDPGIYGPDPELRYWEDAFYAENKIEEKKEPKPKKDILYKLNKKIIRQRVFSFLLGQKKPYLYMFTISFPPCVSDDVGYRCLNTWLTVCRTDYGLKHYLFVAERQKNGTVHFHLLVPQYLDVRKANRAMMVILCNLVRKGELNWNLQAAKRYNGVDIAKSRKTGKITNFALGSASKALSHYITKYISKNDGGFKHLAWHNSRSFSSVMTSVYFSNAEARFLELREYLDLSRRKDFEYGVFIPWNGNMPDFFTSLMRAVNSEILEDMDKRFSKN